ncbi:hypothetical protein [Paenibacillus sp. Leaf72]|uniref:hypothetical protein n=1 Tax=Paenibacillus sp. Leaf72 TaxID=1736234 RepID=UPI0012DDD393|nr:hypothetical protein [Paenibacillus sp. Leaf72]
MLCAQGYKDSYGAEGTAAVLSTESRVIPQVADTATAISTESRVMAQVADSGAAIALLIAILTGLEGQ